MKLSLKKVSFGAVSLVMSLSALVAVPVFAQSGTTGSGSTSSGISKPLTGIASVPPTGGAVKANVTMFKQSGQTLLGQLKQTAKPVTASQRMKFCAVHKQGLANSFSGINSNLAKFQIRIDGVLTKAESYQQTNNVTITDWSTLLASATSAQTTSAAAISALKGVTPSIDCNSASVASDVAIYRAGAKTARDDLKAYLETVRALVHALLVAKAPASPSPTASPTTSPTGGSN